MGRIKIVSLLILFLSAALSQAQVNRYMVFFKDKTGTPFTISNPSAFLSLRSINRRVNQSLTVTQIDLPVNPQYVQSVEATGASVLYRTKWMNGVLVSCDASLISSISALPEVQAVELVAPGTVPNGGRQKSIKKRTSTHEESTANQLSMIGIEVMHADGFKGEGIHIAIFDGGFLGVEVTAPFTHIFDENRFNASASYNYVNGNEDVFKHDDHGTRVFSIIGAYQSGEFTGGAYKAEFQLYLTEDVKSEYRIEEYNWLFAAERSDSSGIDIINSSVGYSTFDNASMNYTPLQMDGITPVVTRAAQFAADRGIVVIASAGNEGNDTSWRVITAPADGEDVLAIGNVNSNGIRSSSSSIGPTGDGRIKPDVIALGSGTYSVRSTGLISTGSGTSFSSPLVVSLAAGLWQRFPNLTNKELIDAIRQSASQAEQPDNFTGYGIPHYTAVKNYLEQSVQKELVAVFPNPITNNQVIIRPINPDDIQNLFFSLINLQGQVVLQGEVEFNWLNNQYTVDLSAFASGIYFLKVKSGEKKIIYKLVKI